MCSLIIGQTLLLFELISDILFWLHLRGFKGFLKPFDLLLLPFKLTFLHDLFNDTLHLILITIDREESDFQYLLI